jgi:hypothetical protein
VPRPAYSADARVWSGAGIPTFVFILAHLYFGSPTEMVQRADDRVAWKATIHRGTAPGRAARRAFRTLEPLLRAYGVSEHEEAVRPRVAPPSRRARAKPRRSTSAAT